MSGSTGTLWLMPNSLDLGTEEVDLREVLPDAVLRRAAQLAHWATENAKSTRAFLKRVSAIHPLSRPIQALQIHELPRPPKGRAGPGDEAAWAALLAPMGRGEDLGLMSEAGLPAVADPGARLVQLAHQAGLRVVAQSGPSSLMLALSASGLEGQHFAFVGYLPQEAAARAQKIKELEAQSRRHGQTQIAIETPYRNQALFEALLAALQPSSRLAISAGLTLPGGFSRTQTVAIWRKQGLKLSDRLPAVFCWMA